MLLWPSGFRQHRRYRIVYCIFSIIDVDLVSLGAIKTGTIKIGIAAGVESMSTHNMTDGIGTLNPNVRNAEIFRFYSYALLFNLVDEDAICG